MQVTNVLSSDVLEDQFGPTYIDIIYQDHQTRAIATRALNGKLLELSYVRFNRTASHLFPNVHQTVINGTSMGKAFRDYSIPFKRHVLGKYLYALRDTFCRLYGDERPAIILDVQILVGSLDSPYATILETYTPDVRAWYGIPTTPSVSCLKRIEMLSALIKENGYSNES